jgi:hypothetical protein
MYSEETTSFKHRYPVRAIALDPRYGQRKTREFVTGGDSGELVLHSRVGVQACFVFDTRQKVPEMCHRKGGSQARQDDAVVRCRAGWASRTRCCTRGRAPSSACAGVRASSRGPTPSAPRSPMQQIVGLQPCALLRGKYDRTAVLTALEVGRAEGIGHACTRRRTCCAQVYDTAAHQRIFTIKRPASAAQVQHAKPHLYWEADSLLYVGWGATITVHGRLHHCAAPRYHTAAPALPATCSQQCATPEWLRQSGKQQTKADT